MAAAIFSILGTLLGAILTLSAQWFMANRQQKDLFRLVSADKRIEVHQQAFALWQELMGVLEDHRERSAVVLRCQEWWYKNCLYLDPEVRKAFLTCYGGAWFFDPADRQMRKELWPDFMAPGRLIPAAVNLPSIGDLEKEIEKLQSERRRK